MTLFVPFLLFVPAQTPAKPIQNPQLAKELARRVTIDQAAREKMIGYMKSSQSGQPVIKSIEEMHKIDADNTSWLKATTVKLGWPTISMVGKEGAHNAWLLAQHVESKKLMREFLDLMTPHVATNEVSKIDYAYITDRVNIGEGKKQVYGTQAMSDGKGGWTIQPTEDPANLDKRRKELGLGTIAEYMKQIAAMYGKSH